MMDPFGAKEQNFLFKVWEAKENYQAHGESILLWTLTALMLAFVRLKGDEV